MDFVASGTSPTCHQPAPSARVLLTQCRSLGIRLWAEGGQLRYAAPKGRIDDRLRAELVEHKPSLIALLSAPPAEPPSPAFDPSERWGPGLDDDGPSIDMPADCWRWAVAHLSPAEWVAWRARSAALQAEFARVTGEPLTAEHVAECDELAAVGWTPPGPAPAVAVRAPDPAPEPSARVLIFLVVTLMSGRMTRDEVMARAALFDIAEADVNAAAARLEVVSYDEGGAILWHLKSGSRTTAEPSAQALKFLVCFLLQNPSPRDEVIAKAAGFDIPAADVELAAVKFGVERVTVDGVETWRMT